MALATPTTQEIDAAIIAQLEASLNQTIPLLPKSFLRVLARTLAGVFIILYKYSGFTFLQIFVQSATIQETEINGRTLSPLIQWGRLIGVGDPAPATNAELKTTITVTEQTGSLPSGTALIGATNGVTYLTIGIVALDASTVTANIRASADQGGGDGSGAIGNLLNGATVNFVNPLPNVLRNTIVLSTITTGADGEDAEVYRQRVLDRFQKRPQGGAYADYEAWAEEPAGILNAYPYTSDCPGQVDVYIEATVESSGSPDGIPTPAQLDEALQSIIFDPVTGIPNRRPANALANTFPITRVEFDVTVLGVTVSNPTEVQAQITQAITDYFIEREPFIVGLSVSPRTDRITSAAIIGIVEDIVNASNGVFSTVVISVSGTPTTLFSLGIGEKAKLGTLAFI